jgi:hypothetical protein
VTLLAVPMLALAVYTQPSKLLQAMQLQNAINHELHEKMVRVVRVRLKA